MSKALHYVQHLHPVHVGLLTKHWVMKANMNGNGINSMGVTDDHQETREN